MLSFGSAGRLINSSGQRCDKYGRITKARGAKGRNSSARRDWDGWQGSHWRDACTELKKLTLDQIFWDSSGDFCLHLVDKNLIPMTLC